MSGTPQEKKEEEEEEEEEEVEEEEEKEEEEVEERGFVRMEERVPCVPLLGAGWSCKRSVWGSRGSSRTY